MVTIGLTGGIGSGKSTVAKMLVELGAVLVDADAISRQLMEPGSPVLDAVVAEFGSSILDAEDRLNRQALAGVVFADDSARERLNGIVHPAVRAESARQVEQAQAQPGFSGVVVEDIPLLAETGQAHRFDAVIVVETQLAARLERLIQARGMSEEDARARIAAQATDEERRAIATWTVDNSGSLEEARTQVERIWEKIGALAA